MKNEGYTLLELIATIIIIGILSLTVIYMVNGQIEKSKKNSFKEDMRSIMRAAELYKEENNLSSFDINISNLELDKIGNLTGSVILNNGIITLYNISNDIYCGNGTSDNYIIEKEICVATPTE